MPPISSTNTSSGPDEHSDIVGGSTADRRLNCTASYRYEQMVPAHLRNQSSSYAAEGTALHAAMQYILEHDLTEDDLPTHILGRYFGETEPVMICDTLINTAIIPCMDFIDALIEELADEGEFLMEIEKRCAMPGIEGAFGTSDIVFRTDKRSGIIDWKFGAGVAVKAEYPSAIDGDPPLGNNQLMFYGRAAAHSLPHMFNTDDPDWPVNLFIVQPRCRDGSPISLHTTTLSQLEDYRLDLIAAIKEATETGGTCNRGDWCKFAACKSVCPLFVGPLLDTTKLAMVTRKTKEAEPELSTGKALETAANAVFTDAADWSVRLAYLLDMAEIAREAADEIFKVAHAHAEQGLRIRYSKEIDAEADDSGDAWKLVPKRAIESYTDEAGAVRHAIGLGVEEDKVYGKRPVKSPAQLAEELEPFISKDEFKTKKERIAEARRQLREFTASVSSGSTLVRGSDARPALISSAEAVNSVASKLALITRK